MQVSSELFCWLRGLKLLESPNFQALADKQTLEDRDAKEIYYGITIQKLIDKVCTVKKIEYLKLNADHSKPIFSKPRMMMNWRAAFTALPKLGLSLDPEMLTLILNGDESMILEVFTIAYHKFGKKVDLQEQDELETLKALGLSESQVPGYGQGNSVYMERNAPPSALKSEREGNSLVPINMPRAKSSMSLASANKTRASDFKRDAKNDSMYLRANLPTLSASTMSRNFSMAGSKLNLSDFNLSMSTQLVPLNIAEIEMKHPRPAEISHLFEYLLVTASDCFNLKVSNIVPIFAGGGKVLANLVVKGVKYEGFKGIVKWFTVISHDLLKVFEMILMDDSWSILKLFLTTIKPGLISKSTEVAELTIGMFTRLFILLKERNILGPA